MAVFPIFSIAPVLEYYGFDDIEDGCGWRTVRCAFHGEQHASASVRTDEEQVYVCHSCGMKGNAVQLIMKREGLSYRDAVGRAEEIAGPSNNAVRGASGKGSSVPGSQRHYTTYRQFKKTWSSD